MGLRNRNVGTLCRPAKPYGRISHLLDWASDRGLASLRAHPSLLVLSATSAQVSVVRLGCCHVY